MCDIIFTRINSLDSIPNDIHKIFDVHITQNGILHSYKNAFESVLIRWMNLEPIIQSEVSQEEKDKYCTLTYACGI